MAEDGEGVSAGVADVDSGERRTVRAAYVLGTDGGSSTTRRLAGIDREGDHATEKRLRLIVRTGDISDRVGPAPSATNIVFNHRASGFLAAVSPREWRVYAGPYPLEPTEDELLAIGRAAFGFDLDLELVSATTFYHATRIATTFRKGRILLAGDAAHVRTPGGNLGEGIGDVANLGWKLAAVLAGHAPDALLDSYDQERRPHNWRVADHSLERSRRSQAALAEIRAGGIPDDADLGDAAVRRRAEIGERLRRDHSGGAGVTLDERYDASDVIWYEDGQLASEPGWRPDVYEDDPRPGHRAPDCRIDPHGSTLHDRIGTSFALLVLTGDPTGRPAEDSTEDPTGRPAGDSAGEPAGRPAEDLIRDRAVVDAFTREAASRSLPLTVIHLTDPDARAVYGAAHVLIRPDQHVAWRGAVLPDGGARAVLDRVLGRARSGAAAQALGAVPAQRVL